MFIVTKFIGETNPHSAPSKDDRASTLHVIAHQAGDVLAHDVEFEIHHRTDPDAAEIGMLLGIRIDRHTETVVARIAYREAHSVYGHRSLLDR